MAHIELPSSWGGTATLDFANILKTAFMTLEVVSLLPWEEPRKGPWHMSAFSSARSVVILAQQSWLLTLSNILAPVMEPISYMNSLNMLVWQLNVVNKDKWTYRRSKWTLRLFQVNNMGSSEHEGLTYEHMYADKWTYITKENFV